MSWRGWVTWAATGIAIFVAVASAAYVRWLFPVMVVAGALFGAWWMSSLRQREIEHLGRVYHKAVADRERYGSDVLKTRLQLDILLAAARPLAEKTGWSFMGVQSHVVRQEEVARNNAAERLRQVIQEITGDTVREKNLRDATGGKTIRVIEDSRMPRGQFAIQPRVDDEGEALPPGFREIPGQPTGYVGEIVDPDYNWAAKAEKTAEDIEGFLRAQDKGEGDDAARA